MFHTVYNSYESKPSGRDYIGKHSSENPYDDYKGSFGDDTFEPDAKIVIAYSKTAEGAVWFEINFHNVFKVAQDSQYANRATQTATKFDRTGASNTPEQNKKISEALRGLMVGEKNPRHGNPVSETTKQKIRESKIGIPRSDETKKKLSESHMGLMRGENHPKSKRVRVTFPDSTVVEFPSVQDASNSLKYDRSTLAKRCRQNHTLLQGEFKGYSFSYAEVVP
jgi:hypothetical protein